MSNLAYLGVVLVVSVVGCGVLWLRNRKPRSMEAHMDEFARVLRAMAPETRERTRPAGRDLTRPASQPRDGSDGGTRPG